VKTQNWSCSLKNLTKPHHIIECQGCVTVIVSLFSVPVKLIDVSRDQTVLKGSNMTLVCEATGKPTPKITLTRVLDDGSDGEILLRRPTWNFPNINRAASGTYRCTATNEYETVSQVFKVNVTCKYFAYPKHCLRT